ncbi:MAG: group II truncated hemoglobin [Burkholderiaceae bacterium]
MTQQDTKSSDNPPTYGDGDASYLAAGEQAGLRKLVQTFYDLMAQSPRTERLINMHPSDRGVSVDKLALFLCGWLGGPRLYNEKYGAIKLPSAHQHLPVTEQDKEDWLWCMQQALDQQDYAPDFKAYLMRELRRPAERIVVVCANNGRQP